MINSIQQIKDLVMLGTSLKQWLGLIIITLFLSNCGLAAAPCRVASAGLNIIPLVGGLAALPADGCAAILGR